MDPASAVIAFTGFASSLITLSALVADSARTLYEIRNLFSNAPEKLRRLCSMAKSLETLALAIQSEFGDREDDDLPLQIQLLWKENQDEWEQEISRFRQVIDKIQKRSASSISRKRIRMTLDFFLSEKEISEYQSAMSRWIERLHLIQNLATNFHLRSMRNVLKNGFEDVQQQLRVLNTSNILTNEIRMNQSSAFKSLIRDANPSQRFLLSLPFGFVQGRKKQFNTSSYSLFFIPNTWFSNYAIQLELDTNFSFHLQSPAFEVTNPEALAILTPRWPTTEDAKKFWSLLIEKRLHPNSTISGQQLSDFIFHKIQSAWYWSNKPLRLSRSVQLLILLWTFAPSLYQYRHELCSFSHSRKIQARVGLVLLSFKERFEKVEVSTNFFDRYRNSMSKDFAPMMLERAFSNWKSEQKLFTSPQEVKAIHDLAQKNWNQTLSLPLDNLEHNLQQMCKASSFNCTREVTMAEWCLSVICHLKPELKIFIQHYVSSEGIVSDENPLRLLDIEQVRHEMSQASCYLRFKTALMLTGYGTPSMLEALPNLGMGINSCNCEKNLCNQSFPMLALQYGNLSNFEVFLSVGRPTDLVGDFIKVVLLSTIRQKPTEPEYLVRIFRLAPEPHFDSPCIISTFICFFLLNFDDYEVTADVMNNVCRVSQYMIANKLYKNLLNAIFVLLRYTLCSDRYQQEMDPRLLHILLGHGDDLESSYKGYADKILGWEWNVYCYVGYTPLMLALVLGQSFHVKVLLEAGAKVSTVSLAGISSFVLSERNIKSEHPRKIRLKSMSKMNGGVSYEEDEKCWALIQEAFRLEENHPKSATHNLPFIHGPKNSKDKIMSSFKSWINPLMDFLFFILFSLGDTASSHVITIWRTLRYWLYIRKYHLKLSFEDIIAIITGLLATVALLALLHIRDLFTTGNDNHSVNWRGFVFILALAIVLAKLV